ncbi:MULTISPECIES: pantoate--beta-alanine ligase [unclassified Pseudodesulfovibrio]|uniref:pantoate--beta-alanine ligase n=1 Tax=unclassified Pseudodesulfovibrio TaxID=2661612 RepID=UPI000FEBF3C9|nr:MULTISPECIES: pantoate--beta-alanine ligase [unclassified Pseudodesulfovibrio]MCJ2164579.1 pantoate--beta-alanine ligase [Pseudodesulfovibrio sp. S3-i]RWU04225.1 pantoate--beta-alanine ligase [Pseudodesulfovibrio sp. S3]
MHIITDPKELQQQCLKWRDQGLTIGLVPTMGFLHEGHMALLDKARPECDRLVTTLFVNPTQFGENEDLSNYPNDFEGDCRKAEAHGSDLLFAPGPDAMYAPDHATWVEVPELGAHLCGASRPIHFRGVCTVVTKLFMLTQADVAVFGQKDWQQFAILRRMVRDLNIPIRLIGHPIVREADGLALSSRNAYLTATERAAAPAIRKGLLLLAEKAADERDCATLKRLLETEYASTLPMGKVDYIEIVDPDSIQPVKTITKSALTAVAIRLGKARLIDNILIGV